MREILFRGIEVESGEWVYGALIKNSYMCEIIKDSEMCDFDNFIDVIPETVSQYTGLKDKNGNKIFEGDVVIYDNCEMKVTYKGDCFGIEPRDKQTCAGKYINFHRGLYLECEDLEIIGNIHEGVEYLCLSEI